MKIIPYDDYNQRIPPPIKWDYIGTITTNIGNDSPRHGWRIIEVEEDTDLR